MTNQEYFNLKERMGTLEYVSDQYDTLTDLLSNYPVFENKSLKEVRDYFSDRITELEAEIRQTLNVQL